MRLSVFIVLAFAVLATAQTWYPHEAEFQRWMAEGGFPVHEKMSIPDLRRQVIDRVGEWTIENMKSKQIDITRKHESLKSGEYPYFAFIPPFVDQIKPDGPSVSWSAPCFKSNEAMATTEANGDVTVTLVMEQPTTLLCSDNYLFATVSGLQIKTFFFHGTHTLNWTVPANLTAAEKWDTKNNGIRIFRFMNDDITTVADLFSTLLLFESELTKGVSNFTADVNLDFLKKYAGVTMEKRQVQMVPVDASLIHSGDFLGVIRLDGLDPMLAWAMGSTTGHTTVALEVNGTMHIAESTVNDSYWPTNGIQITPYEQWIKQAQAAGYNVVWAPLDKDLRAKFNATAAYEKFLELEGLNYGYHNLLFGWIDTVKDNYPCLPPDYTQCLEWQHVEVLFGLLDKIVPAASHMIFNQAMNLRLGTRELSVAEMLQYAGEKGIAMNTVPTVIEQDSWNYNTTRYGKPVEGKAMVCCVFVCNMWKAGGIFDDIDNDFQCGELTNWDDYALSIFDTTDPRPEQCVKADPNNELCQLVGEYTLQLNNYSSKAPYKHMADHCASEAPYYRKKPNC